LTSVALRRFLHQGLAHGKRHRVGGGQRRKDRAVFAPPWLFLPGKPELFLWHDAFEFIREFPTIQERIGVISLDFELLPKSAGAPDPGSGFEAARYLAKQPRYVR